MARPTSSSAPTSIPCRCFLLIGANPAESTYAWAGHVPDGWKRVLAAQAQGAELIVVDPRFTPTAAKADLHVAIKPGEDWAFLLGVIKVVIENGWLHEEDCARSNGLDALRSLTVAVSLADLAARCEVPADTIEDVARRFATAPTAHCVTHTGTSQSRNGALADWLATLLNLITGRIDRPGGRTHNRGLLDMQSMAAPSKVPSRVRGLAPVAGAHTLAELPDEINTPGEGQIKAFIIHAGNPVVSGPDGASLDAALAKLDLLVSVDLFQRESHRHAHWLIPGVHFLEQEEVNPLLVSLHDRPFVQKALAVKDRPPGVRPEWEFFVDVALKMNAPLFGAPVVNRVIRITRWLAKTTGQRKLAFDPSWLAWLMLRQSKKVKWRDVVDSPRGVFYAEKTYGSLWNDLRTPDKKIDLMPQPLVALLAQRLAEPLCAEKDFPLQIITRRRVQNMNSWLADTTGKTVRPFSGDVVEIHPEDAAQLGIGDGQPVRVSSRIASIEAKAQLSDRIRRGVVVMEHGWGSAVYDPGGDGAVERYGVNRNLLIPNDDIDPLTCVPRLNGTPVRLEALATSAAA